VAVPKLPLPLPNKTETLFDELLAVAKSSFPSALKSPLAIARGCVPTKKLVAVLKLPVPVPNSIDTLFEPSLLVAKSGLLSR
jgi:hypothetical protein